VTVELRPLGVSCNLQCQYCYQHPQRDAGNVSRHYDMEKMKAGIRAEGGPFILFGGEALLLPKDDLHELWAWGLDEFGRNTVQTNATLIDDEHFEMFRRYNVHVGVSLDGPAALNDTRWLGTLERTRAATARSQAALERLCDEGFAPSMILTLHRRNAAPEQLPRLVEWVNDLTDRGLGSLRLHLLESETQLVHETYGLSQAENIEAMRAFLRLSTQSPRLRIQPFGDMRKMLLGDDGRTTCTWNGCDPYNTKAVQGVEGDGQRSNCGRTNKDGIDFEKSRGRGMERSLALHRTPQSAGGCQDCRFFMMCKGQCPGTAVDRDWRNRSEHCEVWKALYSDLERELTDAGKRPLSLSPRRPALETSLARAWERGEEVKISRLSPGAAGDRPLKVLKAGGERAFEDSLDFLLPTFSRVSWVNAHSREIWQERMRRVRRAWEEVEWHSVVAGIRACAQLPRSARSVSLGGVLADRHRMLEARELAGGVVIGRHADVSAFAEAADRRDHDAIGSLLGYPECCREFYLRFQGICDLTWPMAVNSSAHRQRRRDSTSLRVLDGNPHANILWRGLGVRGVPHVPCSFDCEATAVLGTRMRDLMLDAGFDAELAWLEEILEWPVEWSALHGIAETKTPILKHASRTHATAGRYTVRRLGDRYPAEGARGVGFPYVRGRARLTSSSAFQRGLLHAAGVETPSTSAPTP
jgi:uncharacterized protein